MTIAPPQRMQVTTSTWKSRSSQARGFFRGSGARMVLFRRELLWSAVLELPNCPGGRV